MTTGDESRVYSHSEGVWRSSGPEAGGTPALLGAEILISRVRVCLKVDTLTKAVFTE